MALLVPDIRYAIRSLRRSPRFVVTCVLTLGLAIGGSLALASVVDAVLWRGLPFQNPDELVVLWERQEQRQPPRDRVSPANFRDWQIAATSFQHLAAFTYTSYALSDAGEPRQVRGTQITANLFSLLGVQPQLGPGFTTQVGASEDDRRVVLSHAIWQQQFGMTRDLLGRRILLDGEPYAVVGVMPPGFSFPDRDVDVWTSMAYTSEQMSTRQRRTLNVVGRLKPGVSHHAAQAESNGIAASLADGYPNTNKGWGIELVGAHEQLVEDVRLLLWLLLAAAGATLLVGSANVGTLILVRALGRRQQVAVQLALGAGWPQLVRQVISETAVIVFVAVGLGLMLGAWLLQAFTRIYERDLPTLNAIELNPRIFVTAALLGCVLTVVMSVASLLFMRRNRLAAALVEGGRGSSRAHDWIRQSLVVAQFAVALMLALGAGLLLRTVANLYGMNPGFNPQGVLTAHIFLPDASYPNEARILTFYDSLMTATSARGELRAAGIVSALPLSPLGANFDLPVQVEGRVSPAHGSQPEAYYRVASPGLFEAIGVPLLRGRGFLETDSPERERVLIINERMARSFFPNEDPIGRIVTIPIGGRHRVVGVVGDVRHQGLDRDPSAEMYVNYRQRPTANMAVVLRARDTAFPLASLMRTLVQEVDPRQPVYDVQEMTTLVANSVRDSRLAALLLGGFAGYSLLLSGLGIFGLMSFAVGQRTREIGVRLAVGATPDSVRRMIMRQGMRLAGVGIGTGIGLAVLFGQTLSGMLFGVAPLDPTTFVSALIACLLVALVANYWPARRASRIDPVIALRQQ